MWNLLPVQTKVTMLHSTKAMFIVFLILVLKLSSFTVVTRRNSFSVQRNLLFRATIYQTVPCSDTATFHLFSQRNNECLDEANGSLGIKYKYAESDQPFFIRTACMADLSARERIIADGFFEKNTNFFTYQIAKLKTTLSLESIFPSGIAMFSHVMIVTCRKIDGKFLGFAELDARISTDPLSPTRSYICNLVIDTKWQQKGIAIALIADCRVLDWQQTSMHLKVRKGNLEAVSMYDNAGYLVLESIKESRGDILLMTKYFGAYVAGIRQRTNVTHAME